MVGVRLADDRRARIPFALLGVLLLVSSATYATTLSTGGPSRYDDTVDTAMERASASTTSALRSAVKDAARDAARNPVTTRADTPAGRALNESTPFRDALRIRIYLTVRDRFDATEVQQGNVVASTSVPAVDDVAELAAAKRRVDVATAGNGTALRVTVRRVTTTAHRARDVVARDTETVTVTVRTPVLLAHQRTSEYERRLNRDPWAGRGLGRRLTARVNAVVWMRSAGQLARAPIANVLGNHHVEVTTNGGALATQRAVFGHDDPQARAGLRWVRGHVALQDLHAATAATLGSATERTYPPAPVDPMGTGAPPRLADSAGRDPRTTTVGVNRTADVAFATLVTGAGETSLASVLRGSYRTTSRLRADVDVRHDGDEPTEDRPGANWTLADEERDSWYSVENTSRGVTGSSLAGSGERFESFTRRVVEEHSLVRVWRHGNETRREAYRWHDEYRVRLVVAGSYEPSGSVPDGAVHPRFERGGALDGPNLADVPDRATNRLLDASRDTLAIRAVEGRLDESVTELYGARPDGLTRWVYQDLTALRAQVRNTSVTVSARRLALGQANPPALLADAVRQRRTALVDAPNSYDGVADRARVAARVAYLDSVVAALEARAATRRTTSGAVDTALGRTGIGSSEQAADALAASERVVTPQSRSVGAGGPGGAVTLVPDGSPGYLTLSTVTDEHVDAVPTHARYRPLTARNSNVFAVPYGDATDGLGSLFEPDPRVDLRTAGNTLVAANRTLARTQNRTLRDRRNRLQRSVRRSLAVVAGETRRVVVRETDLTRREHRAAVEAAFARWNGTGHRALAVTNGSFAQALVGEVRARDDLTAREADRLATRLRVTTGRAAQQNGANVPGDQTSQTASAVRDYAGKTVETYVGSAVENATQRAGKRAARRYLNETVDGVPAGLPVAPAPGYWYATTNVWVVTVRGSYLRFTVRADAGTADGSGTTLQYVRDGSTVALDVDSDGTAERLGRSERLTFETHAVAVAVVPGGNWVGDVDGNADERSAGWADGPGCVGSGEQSRDSACRAD